MDNTKRTIRVLKKELKLVKERLDGYTHMEDDLSYITVHRLVAQKNTIEWVLKMLEGDFDASKK